jgi:hypothetical protein
VLIKVASSLERGGMLPQFMLLSLKSSVAAAVFMQNRSRFEARLEEIGAK